MITVIIKDDGEPNVIKLTYENLYRELKDIPEAKLIVAKNWLEALPTVKTQYACFVEADCLVSSGYFASQLGLIQKNSHLRKLAVFGSSIGVNTFANRFFGFETSGIWSEEVDGIATKNKYVVPVRVKKSSVPYPIQIAYIPGAILRTSMVVPQLAGMVFDEPIKDLVRFSSEISLAFWGGEGRVNINPNATYITTEKYVNDLSVTDRASDDLISMFRRESI